jgi:hypothetical protein
MLEELKCPNCGAKLKILLQSPQCLVCDYCQSQYVLKLTSAGKDDLYKQKLLSKDELFEEVAKYVVFVDDMITLSKIERRYYVDKLRAMRILDELIENNIIENQGGWGGGGDYYCAVKDIKFRYKIDKHTAVLGVYCEATFNSYFIRGLSIKDNILEVIYGSDTIKIKFDDENLLKEEYDKAMKNVIKANTERGKKIENRN